MAKSKKKMGKKTEPKKAMKKLAPKKVAKKSSPVKKAMAKKVLVSKAKKPKKSVSPVKKSTPVKTAPAKSTPRKMISTPTKKLNWNDFVTPLDDRLIVHLERGEKMTAGGLYIPDTVTSSAGHLKGNVVAVGRGHRDSKGKVRPMDVQVGHQVLFTEHAGSKVNWNGQEVIILRENDVLGIVD